MKRLVKVGNVVVPIYQLGNGLFMPVWREGGRIIKRRFTKLDKARRVAEEAAIRIANGSGNTGSFTRIRTGPFRDLFLAEKNDHNLSGRYLRGLRDDWQKFTSVHSGWLDEIRALDISKYLRELAVSHRRRNNVRDELVTGFLFAKEHSFIPYDRITEAEKVKRIKIEYGPPRIYSPEQLHEIIGKVSEDWLDWVLLGAFAGIRPEETAMAHKSGGELLKLSWHLHFFWDDRQILIPAAISKTRRDRYVTINETLWSWISSKREIVGPVCTRDRPDRETERLGRILNFPWIQDGLRHSFASYWQSIHRNMALLKEEMGNSEQVNRRFYYHAQPKSIAAKWFSQTRQSLQAGRNIVAMRAA